MDYVLIVFASATTANRLKSILWKKFRIDSTVMQTPQSLPVISCSYCIRLRQANMDVAWEIVKRSGLSTKGIFREYDYEKLR